MTKSAPTVKQHAAKIIKAGAKPVFCVIAKLSRSGVVVSSNNKLSALSVGDNVEVQVNTRGSRIVTVKTRVERCKAKSAQLRYIDPWDKSINKLGQWFYQKNPVRKSKSHRALLDELNKITSDHVASLLDAYFDNAQNGLLKLAEFSESNSQQNKLFETMSLMQRQRDQIKQLSCNTLASKLTGQTQSRAQKQTQEQMFIRQENLELLDLTQFENWLSLETIIRRANEQYHQPLIHLQHRYSRLLNRKITLEQLPISVDNICHSVQQALKTMDFEPELLPVVYRFFDESVVSRLGPLYQTLNNRFKEHGILPDLESQPIASKQRLKTNLAQQPQSEQAEQDTPDNGTQLPGYSAQLMETVRSCQELVNSASGNNGAAQTQNMLSMDDMVAQLTRIQHNTAQMNAMMNNLSLQQILTANTDSAVPPEANNLVNLVESIFKTADTYPHISNALLSSFKRLQAPIAKAALLDPGFFSSENHPARVLLNQMIDLSLNSEIPNNALEQQFEKLISQINIHYNKDNRVFEKAIKALSSVSKQQEKTYSRNTNRLVQTYEGKQLLKLATDTVANEIHQRLKPPKAPQVLVELMDNGWRELLKVTYLKQGPDSKSWIENLKIIDQLLEWFSDIDKNNILNKNPQRLAKADSLIELIEQKLHNVFPGNYHYGGTIASLKKVLKGRAAVSFVDIDPLPHTFNELAEELKSSKPEMQRWFKLAESVAVGDEFSYINDDGSKKNIKLIWISDDKQHFVFVNNRGQKILDFDLFNLANEFSNGLIPTEKQSELPLVERSLYSTIQQAYEKLAFKSSHDELTGLLSRKECDRILSEAIKDAKNNAHDHCLLYIDIDQFSLINDIHGHIAGDQQLVEIAKLIQTTLPDDTIVGRMAGNEFIVLLQNRDAYQYIKLSEDLRATIEKHPFKWKEHQLQLTASIGLVTINEYTKNVINLIRNATEACQAAKKNGGNRFYDFRQDSELHTRREKLLSWIDKLDHLLRTNKLVLRAQAITPTKKNGDDTHYEILIALRDNKGRLRSPAEFIEAAESYSRMQKVDRWVIDKTFHWLQQIERSDYKTPSISINLSGNSLNDDTFAEFLLDRFKHYNIPRSHICFEVTETATLNNIAEVADFIREIKQMGCKFSLDDFGSGNASYQYLRHLPVDYVKIDGMFVREIDKNPNDFALVKSIHEIARLMGKKTVAEFAENQKIVNILSDIGVDYIQGYAIGMPQLLHDIQLETLH